ncbi:putative type VI secretion protein [Xenorhabdus szentirmaii]|nr:putative type VI secretion protein [Xenorhabdus szentirmaii]
MKIYRPLWTDGAFLAPQQFQQQARWGSYVTDIVANMGIAHPWGYWKQSLMKVHWQYPD